MWQWYSPHRKLQGYPQAGYDHERKTAEQAHSSVKQWLFINSKRYCQEVPEKIPAIYSWESGRLRQMYAMLCNVSTWTNIQLYFTENSTECGPFHDNCHLVLISACQEDDVVLAEALAMFERQGVLALLLITIINIVSVLFILTLQ